MAGTDEKFGESYWRDRSHYRKFRDYSDALRSTMRWYSGFFRLVGGELPAPGRHVDAGCGHGALMMLLAARGFDAHGFDVSEWIVEQAREELGVDSSHLTRGNLDSGIPFEGSFGLITCLEVLEHVPDPAHALRVLGERLEPGGRLIATTPNLAPRIPWHDQVAADPTHINVHEPGWWRECVAEAGLRLRRLSTFITVPVIWRLGSAFSIWIPMGETTGPGTLIVTERTG